MLEVFAFVVRTLVGQVPGFDGVGGIRFEDFDDDLVSDMQVSKRYPAQVFIRHAGCARSTPAECQMDMASLGPVRANILSKPSSRHDFAPQYSEVFGSGSHGRLIIDLYM